MGRDIDLGAEYLGQNTVTGYENLGKPPISPESHLLICGKLLNNTHENAI